MELSQLLSWVGTGTGMLIGLPQLVKTVRTKKAGDLFPLGGMILGVTFLHEQLTWQVITGAIIIIFSLVIANWEPRKKLGAEKQQLASG